MKRPLGRIMSVAMWSRGKSLEAVIELMSTEVRISVLFICYLMDRSLVLKISVPLATE
jgi:hypothetical protein